MPRRIDEKPFVAFEIKDSGPGIEPEKLHELFAPFAQVNAADTARHGGLGLGLAISQRAAEVLGWEHRGGKPTQSG